MKGIIKGTSNFVLEVNLNKREFKKITVPDKIRKMYLGGKGLALKLLYDRLSPKINPLSEDNIIIFATGVLIGTGAPNSARFSAVTKSPLTGIITSSSCGGPFGMALKTSGWDGLIIRGRANKPVILRIDSNGVEFKDSSDLWGKDTVKTQKTIDKHGNGSLIIGPAGENLVKYANIASGHRFLGRGGMGAVLGSKNVKGVVAKGNEFKIIPRDIEKFKKTVKRANKYINVNDVTSNLYRNYGTASNVKKCNEAGILPVRNFSYGSHKKAELISGEYIKQEFDTKFYSCKQCSILCGHSGNFNIKKDDSRVAVPEYETIGLLGSNLEIFEPEKIAEWNDICSRMGMDTISVGGTLAWAMEATERGIFKSELKFGKSENIGKILYDIAYQRSEHRELSEGSRNKKKKYGGKEFAIQVKGLELGAYDPRGSIGMGLNYAVANRGACHLSSAIFSLEVFFNILNPFTTRAKASIVRFFENFNSAINSLHTCQFTAYAYTLEPFLVKYTPVPILRFFMQNLPSVAVKFLDVSIYAKLWSSITGLKLTNGDFLKAGERVHILERYMNTREGIGSKDDTLPKKLLNEKRRDYEDDKGIKLEKMLNEYYRLRGYNSDGIPPKKILKNLGII